MKYDVSAIMKHAWVIHNKNTGISFGECLHRAWQCAKVKPVNDERIQKAKEFYGITEPVNTWYQWKLQGYEVQHGSTRLFWVDLIDAAKGEGAIYKASFFGVSQVNKISDFMPCGQQSNSKLSEEEQVA